MMDFKKIHAWQRAHLLGIAIDTRAKGFSRKGHASLRAQIVNSASGIAATIAEGCGASTKKELARFLEMAIKSASETEHHLLDARDFQLISPEVWAKLSAETIEIRKMIVVYRRKVLESIDESHVKKHTKALRDA